MAGLNGAAVLITRPQAYADCLRDEVCRLGGRPIVFPTLGIEHCTQGLDDGSFTEHDLAIFISRNAVAAVAEYFKRTGGQWPESLRCAAVGGRTAAALRREFGARKVIAPTENYGASALMDHPSMQKIAGEKVIFFDGGGARSVLLVRMLEDKGCEVVTHAVVYNRVRPQSDASELKDALRSRGVDFIVLTSVEAADNLFDMLDKAFINELRHASVIAYSRRIQKALQPRGFENIFVSDVPSDETVIELMTRLWKQNDLRNRDSNNIADSC